MPNQKGFSKIAIIIILVFIVVIVGFVKYFNLYEKMSDKVISTNTKDFEDTGIIVISPEHSQTIFSPLKITGYINDLGDGWEADFGSVELVDGNGKRIAITQLGVDATDDKGNYKEKPYYFESTLVFNESQTTKGSLIFYENTARGDMTEKFRLPIKFDKYEDQNNKINPKDYSLVNYPLEESPISDQLKKLELKTPPDDYWGGCFDSKSKDWKVQEDTRLVKNGSEIIVPSIRKLFFETNNKNPDCVTIIRVFSTPNDGKYIYLIIDTISFKEFRDIPIYRLDLLNLSIEKLLNVSDNAVTYFKIGENEEFLEKDDVLLPDGKRVINLDESNVYLIDMETDSKKVLYTTSQNQWLISHVYDGALAFTYHSDIDVKTKENQIVVGVYDKNLSKDGKMVFNDEGKIDWSGLSDGKRALDTVEFKFIKKITIPIPVNKMIF